MERTSDEGTRERNIGTGSMTKLNHQNHKRDAELVERTSDEGTRERDIRRVE